jgi:hypothetical protein
MSTINSHRLSRDKFYSIPNSSSDQLIIQDELKNPAFSNDNETSTIVINSPHTIVQFCLCSLNSSISPSSSTMFFRHSFSYYIWRLFICLITILFATVWCSTIYLAKIGTLHNITIENTRSICQLLPSNLNIYYKIPANYVSLGILLTLILSQLFFENFSCRKKTTWKTFWKHLSIPMIFNAHSHIYRFQSAAVFGIIALEIVNIFDEYIIHGARYFIYGPLVNLMVQFGIGLLLSLRYCPILSIFEKENNYKDRLGNIISYGLGAIYLYFEIIFKILWDIDCASDKGKMSMIKESLKRLRQMGVNVEEYMIYNLGANRTNGRSLLHNIKAKYGKNLAGDDMDNELESLDYALELNEQSIFYNILRNAPYYYFITYLAVCLTILFINTFRHLFISTSRQKSEKSSSLQSLARWKYVKYNLLKTTKYIHSYEQKNYSRLFHFLNSLIFFFKEHIYSIRPYFRYSKLIICINTSALTLVYYFTFWIQDRIYIITERLLFLLQLVSFRLANLSKDLCQNRDFNCINQDIKYICFLTASIICLQLFLGLKHYQIQMCKAYRGVFTDIPKLKYMSSVSIVSKSIRYPGRFIGKLTVLPKGKEDSSVTIEEEGRESLPH